MGLFTNRGFQPKRPSNPKLPPGQYETTDFPVLTAGPTPRIALTQWEFRLEGLVEEPMKWSWEEFNKLPMQDFNPDIHCVTKWSKFDTHWRGVSVDTLLEHVKLKPEAKYVTQFCYGGYTTNLPLADMLGGTARLVVPHLYFWKSAKWAQGLRFTATDEAGFWERGGYSMYGDPWKEQRYRDDDDDAASPSNIRL
jgi:DMSO/TMAO reductase YedYZ molybdopterin-dependent catalytic subunit